MISVARLLIDYGQRMWFLEYCWPTTDFWDDIIVAVFCIFQLLMGSYSSTSPFVCASASAAADSNSLSWAIRSSNCALCSAAAAYFIAIFASSFLIFISNNNFALPFLRENS